MSSFVYKVDNYIAEHYRATSFFDIVTQKGQNLQKKSSVLQEN